MLIHRQAMLSEEYNVYFLESEEDKKELKELAINTFLKVGTSWRGRSMRSKIHDMTDIIEDSFGSSSFRKTIVIRNKEGRLMWFCCFCIQEMNDIPSFLSDYCLCTVDNPFAFKKFAQLAYLFARNFFDIESLYVLISGRTKFNKYKIWLKRLGFTFEEDSNIKNTAVWINTEKLLSSY
jgi:hypothetical protein